MELDALLAPACFMRSKGIASMFTNMELDAVMMTSLLAHNTMTFLSMIRVEVRVELVHTTRDYIIISKQRFKLTD